MKLPFKPWLDQAGAFPISHIAGIPHYNTPVSPTTPRTGVLHTTEGGWAGSLAIFRVHYAPHFMLGYDATAKEVRIAQLVQVGTIGAALKAHNNKALVQIEMIGFSKPTPWLPDDGTVEALASLMAVCFVEYGIPLTRPWADGDFGKAGPNPHRTSGNYGTVAGWYGHGDCPSPDTHWDPGNLEWSKVFAKAQTIANSMGPSSDTIGPAAMAGIATSNATSPAAKPK
ncbi:N-acetylmuramoyl-L-alanine amidase [Mesorhizobium sp. 113-1-2]|uniref:N-acetylmuramoyl-L-alanine amidase n=1 Tax=Mesorhizobium sp. 113-1-2 TaxID=2744515 RepID=UPI000BBB2F65|nr:N-acetylmuramoyl-L-alanine amidase [Mesorhizobium sp. 113-1-2]